MGHQRFVMLTKAAMECAGLICDHHRNWCRAIDAKFCSHSPSAAYRVVEDTPNYYLVVRLQVPCAVTGGSGSDL